VVTRQGLGTFVTEPAKPFTALLSRVAKQPPVQGTSTVLPEVSRGESETETSRLFVERAPASLSVAEKLEVAPGELVVVRRRSGSVGEVPWMMMASYFPLDVAAGTPLEQAGEIGEGSIKLLADLGYTQVGFVDEIGARMPNTREFTFFGLSTGTPVVVINRTAYTKDRPIRMTRYVYRADRVRLTHEVGDIPNR
jgi:GntR family transcriptional regulator